MLQFGSKINYASIIFKIQINKFFFFSSFSITSMTTLSLY